MWGHFSLTPHVQVAKCTNLKDLWEAAVKIVPKNKRPLQRVMHLCHVGFVEKRNRRIFQNDCSTPIMIVLRTKQDFEQRQHAFQKLVLEAFMCNLFLILCGLSISRAWVPVEACLPLRTLLTIESTC